MSGSNVWLKLKRSEKFKPEPYLLDTAGDVWHLPYALTLNHTVEEIMASCKTAERDEKKLHELISRVREKLSPDEGEITQSWFIPKKMTLQEFIKNSNYVFIGLHGGIGENGELQKMLEKAGVPYNGSDSKASHLCMNKAETGEVLRHLEKEGIYTAERIVASVTAFGKFTALQFRRYWKHVQKTLGTHSLIVKPVGDGCSAGIARLFSHTDLETYIRYAARGSSQIPQGSLTEQHGIIEMPTARMNELMLERFIVTDKVKVIGSKLKWESKTDWIEITMGLLEQKGKLKAMNPSLTVALGNVLSLEEKFQGGTGINITPPPAPYVKPSALKKAKARMEKVAKILGISGYARIDAFMQRKTGELIIIEANTVPGLTPSTVIYHQALAEDKPLYPKELLETIVDSSI